MDQAEEILYTQKQGMGQFAMTTYYQLSMHVPVQEAAQKTLESIEEVRKMFLANTSSTWKQQALELLSIRYDYLIKLYSNVDEQFKKAVRDEALAIREIHDALSNITVGEYPNGQGNESTVEQTE